MSNPIQNNKELRTFYGEPTERGSKKQLKKLDQHCRNFIALSPFLVIASANAAGADASPRGDAAGFVKVIDDYTLLVPDRPGNNRVDTLGNILDNPNVGLLFLVPGINETLRVNGKAGITTEEDRLRSFSVKGKTPKTGLVIKVEEVYFHCAKAIIRSKLWAEETKIQKMDFPPFGKILTDQIDGLSEGDTERVIEEIEESYKIHLY